MDIQKLAGLLSDKDLLIGFSNESSFLPKNVVYLLIDSNEIVYIGKSVNYGFYTRYREHLKNKSFTSVKLIRIEDANLAFNVEQALIGIADPKYNKQGGRSIILIFEMCNHFNIPLENFLTKREISHVTKTRQYLNEETMIIDKAKFYKVIFEAIRIDLSLKGVKIKDLSKKEIRYVISKGQYYNIKYISEGKKAPTLSEKRMTELCKYLGISFEVMYKVNE